MRKSTSFESGCVCRVFALLQVTLSQIPSLSFLTLKSWGFLEALWFQTLSAFLFPAQGKGGSMLAALPFPRRWEMCAVFCWFVLV